MVDLFIAEFGGDVISEVADHAHQEDDCGHNPEGSVEIGAGFYFIDELVFEGRYHGCKDAIFYVLFGHLEILFPVIFVAEASAARLRIFFLLLLHQRFFFGVFIGGRILGRDEGRFLNWLQVEAGVRIVVGLRLGVVGLGRVALDLFFEAEHI